MKEITLAEVVDKIDWKEVPSHKFRQLESVFQSSRESLNLSHSCPICSAKTLHRWYMPGQPIDIGQNGIKYVARGALWEWCSTCGSYMHYSAKVPDFWKSPSDFQIDKNELGVVPWAIEHARQKMEQSHQHNSAKEAVR
jgi:hypothetical protein